MDYLHVQADNPWYNYYIKIDQEIYINTVFEENAGLDNDQPYNAFFSIKELKIALKDKEKFLPGSRLHTLYRGSYMSAHVLLNLLNELGKRDKMRGLPSILSLFRNEFNKFNNTRARMLDSIYHMTNTLKSHFWRKNVMILSSCTQRCYGRNNVSRKSINH